MRLRFAVIQHRSSIYLSAYYLYTKCILSARFFVPIANSVPVAANSSATSELLFFPQSGKHFPINQALIKEVAECAFFFRFLHNSLFFLRFFNKTNCPQITDATHTNNIEMEYIHVHHHYHHHHEMCTHGGIFCERKKKRKIIATKFNDNKPPKIRCMASTNSRATCFFSVGFNRFQRARHFRTRHSHKALPLIAL